MEQRRKAKEGVNSIKKKKKNFYKSICILVLASGRVNGSIDKSGTGVKGICPVLLYQSF